MVTPVPQPALFLGPEPTTEVLLIRHGRSAAVVPGTPESLDPPLADEGHAQAAALAARLGAKHIDAIYSSDLTRAVQTAAYLAAPRGLEVVERPDLREVFLGEWEGGEFRRRAADGDAEFLAFVRSGSWDLIPGSEGDAALRARARDAVGDIAAAHLPGCVAVVCHGGIINAYLAEAVGSDRVNIAILDNTSVSAVRVGSEADPRVLLTVNDVHHLYDPLVAAGVPAG